MLFKIGDKVRVSKNYQTDANWTSGLIGKIYEVGSDYVIIEDRHGDLEKVGTVHVFNYKE